MARSYLYQTWVSLRHRCNTPEGRDYSRYGGRGIKVCERWNDFETFASDMGERPSSLHSIDRIDNNGPYSPENCRWATRKEQADNRCSTDYIEYDGKRMTLIDWSRATGLSQPLLWTRLYELNWGVERSLSTPPRKYIRKTK